MCEQIGGVEQTVLQLEKKMFAISTVLETLVPKSSVNVEEVAETSTPTLAQEGKKNKLKASNCQK